LLPGVLEGGGQPRDQRLHFLRLQAAVPLSVNFV
jgi:hypothetical protein